MKYTLLLCALCACGTLCAQNPPENNPYLETPFALEADGKPIDVTNGHSAPLIYDFNKDGVNDLLVGEFGEVDYDGIESGEAHDFVQGRCRVYLNHGTNARPEYRDFTYLSAGGVPMAVPVTCCISFVPRIVDMDGDGIDDVISGSYPSEMFIWKGKGNMDFEPGKHFTDLSGNNLLLPDGIGSMCIDPVDWDGDGDYDLFASTRGCGFFLFENIGDARNYRFKDAVEVPMKDDTWWLNYYCPFDWDGDGLFDLVGGKEFGDLVWARNIGKPGKPEFGPLTVLRKNPDHSEPAPYVRPLGGRPKIWVCDYNMDGKNDIVAGDASDTEETLWELSPRQARKRDKIDLQWKNSRKVFFDKNPDILKLVEENGSDKVDHPKYLRFRKFEEKLWAKKEKANRNILYQLHGYVWVFLGK